MRNWIFAIVLLTACGDVPCNEIVRTTTLQDVPRRCWEHKDIEEYRSAFWMTQNESVESVDSGFQRLLDMRPRWQNDSVFSSSFQQAEQAMLEKNPANLYLGLHALDEWDAGRGDLTTMVKISRAYQREFFADSARYYQEDIPDSLFRELVLGSTKIHVLVRILERVEPSSEKVDYWNALKTEIDEKLLQASIDRSGFSETK